MSAIDIAVPFPSGRPNREKLARALDFLRSWPVQVHCPLQNDTSRWQSHPAYLSGSDSERARELLGFWSEQDTSIVWCGRGGYGATRLLSVLESSLGSATFRPTRFLGYSDITALFAFVRSRGLPLECIHAPVLTEIPDHPEPGLVLAALHGQPCPLPVHEPAESLSDFRGTVWGGNLAVLASLCGTPWLPRPEEAAIFLEDVDEAPYRLDRFVTQLHDSGFFDGGRGVFLGQFTRCGPDLTGLEIVKERLSDLGLKLLGQLPVGHEAHHLPLFLDRSYRFDPTLASLLPE